MLLDEIVNNIHMITKRPDQRPMTILAIKDALQRLHNTGELVRDLKYATLSLPALTGKATQQMLDLPADYRKMSSVFRHTENSAHLYGEGKLFLTAPENVRNFLSCGNPCYHIVGKQIVVFDYVPFDQVVIQYYKRCILTQTFIQEDWIIDDYNEMFTHLAASIVFANLRNVEECNLHLRDYQLAREGFLLNELEDGNATDLSVVDNSWVGSHG